MESPEVMAAIAVVGSVTSLVGGGFLGAWLLRRHERQLRRMEQDHALVALRTQNEFNVLLQDDKRRADQHVEHLKASLEQERLGYSRVHELAAEREFVCYTEIWRDLMNYLNLFQGRIGHHVEGDRSSWEQQLKLAREAFVRTFRDSRPFYDDRVFQACVNLNDAAAQIEAISGLDEQRSRRGEWLSVMNGEVNKIVEAIRHRIARRLPLGGE